MSAARLLTSLSLAVAFLGDASPTSAQGFGRGPIRAEVRALVKKIDAAGKKITVTQPGAGRGEVEDKTFALADDVEIALDNTPRRGVYTEGKLGDIAEGAMVGLLLGADQKSVESIAVEGPQLRAQIKSVDPAKKTLTVAVFNPARREEGPEEKTYDLVAGAEIAVDDGLNRRFSVKEAKLADVAAGTLATLRLTIDQKQVISVLAEGANLSGRVKSVEPGKKSITLTLGPRRGEDAEEEKTVELSKSGIILVDDGRGRRLSVKEVTLGDVPVGAQVFVRLSGDQKYATLVRAEGPMMPGLLKAVDSAKNTITIALPSRDNPQEKTLPLAKGARITLGGNETKLADLKITDEGPFVMLRLTLDQKTVQAVIVNQGR